MPHELRTKAAAACHCKCKKRQIKLEPPEIGALRATSPHVAARSQNKGTRRVGRARSASEGIGWGGDDRSHRPNLRRYISNASNAQRVGWSQVPKPERRTHHGYSHWSSAASGQRAFSDCRVEVARPRRSEGARCSHRVVAEEGGKPRSSGFAALARYATRQARLSFCGTIL